MGRGPETLLRLSPSRFGPALSLQETSALQFAASSAGYSTGGTIVTASVGYLLLAGHPPPAWALLLWTFFGSALGVVLASPMQRVFIRYEPLPFPSGQAAASVALSTTLKAMPTIDVKSSKYTRHIEPS